MLPTGFEPTIPGRKRPQTHALDRAATAIGGQENFLCEIWKWRVLNRRGNCSVICMSGSQNVLNCPFKTYWLRDAPTGLIFNCTLCPHCIYVFCVYLRTNSDLCHLQHKLIGFYNRDEKCLQRGKDWGFKYSGLRFVFKGLTWEITPYIKRKYSDV